MKQLTHFSFSPPLKELHSKLEQLRKEKEALEQAYQKRFRMYPILFWYNSDLSSADSTSLTLKSSPQLGFHVHIKKRDATKLLSDDSFIHLSESGSTKTFFHEVYSFITSENMLNLCFSRGSNWAWQCRKPRTQ